MSKVTIRVLYEPPTVGYTLTAHSFTVEDRDSLDRVVRVGLLAARSVDTEPWCHPPQAAGKTFSAQLLRCPVEDHELILHRMTEFLVGRDYQVCVVDRAEATKRLIGHMERFERERGFAQALSVHYERCAEKARLAAERADKRLRWCADHAAEPETIVQRLDFGSLPRELRA